MAQISEQNLSSVIKGTGVSQGTSKLQSPPSACRLGHLVPRVPRCSAGFGGQASGALPCAGKAGSPCEPPGLPSRLARERERPLEKSGRQEGSRHTAACARGRSLRCTVPVTFAGTKTGRKQSPLCVSAPRWWWRGKVRPAGHCPLGGPKLLRLKK